MIKAYEAWDNSTDYGYITIVFAQNTQDAKRIAYNCCDLFEDTDYIQIRVRRCPAADKLYNGQPEIDWYDKFTRLVLVKELHWHCLYISDECDTCIARKDCAKWEDLDD